MAKNAIGGMCHEKSQCHVEISRRLAPRNDNPVDMTESTFFGIIEISPTAIASLAGQAVLESYGVVGFAPRYFRDGIQDIFPRHLFRRGVQVHIVNNEITIDLYVVIEYGTRISEVAHGLMNRVKYVVEQCIGMPVAAVNVHVQGLRVSKDS